MARERIGIMGGTFNPIHQGHISMAKAAMASASLDRVLMLPSGSPPHKQHVAPAEDRWKMVCAAVCQEPALEPCRMELDRGGTTYTVDTLSTLKEAYPKAELFYIIGADTLMELKNWRSYEQVLHLCAFLVCPRACNVTPEALAEERRRLTALGGRFQMVDMEVVTVSSTALREALSAGEPTPRLPVTVREFCGLKGLYGMQRRCPQADIWLDKLFATLSRERFGHTLAVAHTARQLAQIHGVDVQKAECAALLHDCAKCMPLTEMQRLSQEHALTRDTEIFSSGRLLHALAGSYLAAWEYGVEDPDILRAIACHTTGKVDMTPLEVTVYLADKIEPTRPSYPLLDKVRLIATLSMLKAMRFSLEGTISYVKKSGKKVHPQSQQTLDWLKTLPEAQ